MVLGKAPTLNYRLGRTVSFSFTLYTAFHQSIVILTRLTLFSIIKKVSIVTGAAKWAKPRAKEDLHAIPIRAQSQPPLTTLDLCRPPRFHVMAKINTLATLVAQSQLWTRAIQTSPGHIPRHQASCGSIASGSGRYPMRH